MFDSKFFFNLTVDRRKIVVDSKKKIIFYFFYILGIKKSYIFFKLIF